MKSAELMRGMRSMKSAELMRFLLMGSPLLAVLPMAGCEVASGIFTAGVYVGVIVVVLIAVAVAFVATRMRS